MANVDEMKMTQQEKMRRRRRSIIREFCVNTTAHGLPGIIRSRTRCSCLFWSTTFLGFTGIMIFFLVKAIVAYFNYPTNIDTQIISEWPQFFPAFSFCNASPFRLNPLFEAVQNYSIQNNLTTANDTTGSAFQYSTITSFVISTLNKNESISSLFFSISSMLWSCKFNNMPCSKDDFIPFTSTNYGACYTFNAKLRNTTNKTILYANQGGGEGKLAIGLYIHTDQYPPYMADGKLKYYL
ncbi:MAG: amiloride-sensitive sodium channel family protein [Ignavibacteria bacterium]|nr:amiloride-sensitive sodium channel family protein [Ignavibacteria bacterium]